MEILEAVAPGRDDHLYFSIRVLARFQARDGIIGSARELLAQQRVKAALMARYGSQFMDDSDAVAKVMEAVAYRLRIGREPECGRLLIA